MTQAETIDFAGQEVWAVATTFDGDDGEAFPHLKEYFSDNYDAEFESTATLPDRTVFFADGVELEGYVPGEVDLFLEHEENEESDRYFLVVEMSDGFYLNPHKHPILFTNTREIMTKAVRRYIKNELESEIDALEDQQKDLEKQLRKNDRTVKRNAKQIAKNERELQELKQENTKMEMETRAIKAANEVNAEDLRKVNDQLQAKESKLELIELK